MNDAIVFWPIDIKEELRSHIFKHAVFQHLKMTMSETLIQKQSLGTSLKKQNFICVYMSLYLLINSYIKNNIFWKCFK